MLLPNVDLEVALKIFYCLFAAKSKRQTSEDHNSGSDPRFLGSEKTIMMDLEILVSRFHLFLP